MKDFGGRLFLNYLKKTQILAAFCLGTVAFSACDPDGPDNVYYGMTTAASMGDYEGFLMGFTDESRRLVESQLSLSEAYGLAKENPVSMLVFSDVDQVEIDGDEAILSVSRGRASRRILMVKDPELGWRIDVKKLGEFWDKERKSRRR